MKNRGSTEISGFFIVVKTACVCVYVNAKARAARESRTGMKTQEKIQTYAVRQSETRPPIL